MITIKCCKKPMLDWVDGAGRRVWRCDVCGKVKPQARRPLLWGRVRFSDLEDRQVKPGWWLGVVASDPDRYLHNKCLFVVIPVNVLINLARRLYYRLRVQLPNGQEKLINEALLRGMTIGAARERERWRRMQLEDLLDERGFSVSDAQQLDVSCLRIVVAR